MRRVSSILFGIAALYSCSGSESTLPTGSSLGSEKSVRPNLNAAAVSGIVKNALDGQPVGGIIVEIPGVASVTTGGDGAFTLDGAGGAPLPLVLRGDGYHTRETHMLSSTVRAEIDVLPMNDKFDLDFFDHVFRDLGEGHTLRWTQEPRFEIWTGVYEHVEGEFYGDLLVSDELAPERFPQLARDVIAADTTKYTGGVLLGNDVVVLPPHPMGTRLGYTEYFKPFTITVLLLRGGDASLGPSWPYESGRIYAASIWMQKRYHKDEHQVFSHELAHTLGFFHPAGSENVPLPSIMRAAENVTSHDMLHGSILYRRPPGSRTADKDPETFVVNALRDGAEAGPPDPSGMRLVRN
jgi:hypothetical protein